MSLLSKWVESLDYENEILPFCSRFISRRSTCEKCVESCNEKAISIVKLKPVLESSKCLDCGKCISACPVQAIAGIYPKREIVHHQFVIKSDKLPAPKELVILVQ